MLIRTLTEVAEAGLCIDWGNGTSHRLLIERDGMGFSICRTMARAGSRSRMQYTRHAEACYCVAGCGQLIDGHGVGLGLRPGTLYVLSIGEVHELVVDPESDMELISIFSPAIQGHERHKFDGEHPSSY